MADYLAWKEFMRTNATSFPPAGIENDKNDDNVNDTSHTINLSLLSWFWNQSRRYQSREAAKGKAQARVD